MSRYRLVTLDIVRAFAILLVLVNHLGAPFLSLPGWAGSNSVFNCAGYLGVEVFFGLSGILIGGILLKDLPDSLSQLNRFWMRRWLRTLPPYFMVLTIMWIVARPNADLIDYIFFLQSADIAMDVPNSFFGVSWSLCVEEWAYLILPLVLFGATPRSARRRILLLILGTTVLRWWAILSMGLNYDTARWFAFLRIDAILWGVLAATYRNGMLADHRWLKYLLPAAAVTPAIFICSQSSINHPLFLTFGFLLLNASVALSLPAIEVIGSGFLQKAAARLRLPFIAEISYPLYLTHLAICIPITMMASGFVESVMGNTAASASVYLKAISGLSVFIACGFVLSMILAHIIHVLIEVPMMRWRDRVFPAINGRIRVQMGNNEENAKGLTEIV